MTPSAPRSKALMMNSGSMRPLQGRRMMRTLLAMRRRLVPARSAPVYVHQLQTKAVMRGSKPSAAAPLVSIASLTSLPVAQSVDLAEDLLVGEGLQLYALAEADRLAGAATLAHAGVHVGDVAADVAVDGADIALLDGAVGAHLGAVHAADAGVFVDNGHRRLALEFVGAEQAHYLGAGGASHRDGVGDVARRRSEERR